MKIIFDTVIKNGKVITGDGNPWFYADIAVKNGRIEKISGRIANRARDELDCKGKYVCPGFIDAHTHSDFVFFIESSAQSKIRQGVTTEVTGNCGMSGAPFSGRAREQVKAKLYGYEPDWEGTGDYISALSRQPSTVNIAPLLGHGTLRAAAVGFEDRPPAPDELDQMKISLEEGLKAGAFGLSLGLYFMPGSFASQDEIIQLAGIISDYNGIITAHIRDEGKRTVGFIPAVKEVVEIARKAGVPLQISHIKAFGPDVRGYSKKVIKIIEEARTQGIDITCDQYPYTATGGIIASDTLPLDFQQGKSPEMTVRELKNKGVRKRLRERVAVNIEKRGGAPNQILANYPYNKKLEGRSLQDIAVERNQEPAEVVMDLLIDCYEATWVSRALSPEDVNNFIKYRGTMIGSDGSSLEKRGPLSEGSPHPRNFGAFPHVLTTYVRDKGVLKLEEAIRKMTSFPARRFSIANRGLLEEGYCADIIIFDLEQMTDASFSEPAQFPEGIPHVMVNGNWVIREDKFTGNLPGELAVHHR